MRIVANRKWTVADRVLAGKIRDWLIERGGEEEKVFGPHEVWRVRQAGAKWTYYSTGTLYVTDSDDASLLEAQRYVDVLVGARFVPATRDFLVGLDETGKGEIFGPVVLAGVVFPRELFQQIEDVIGVADTKIRHAARYWEELFARIDFYRAEGLHTTVEKITPAEMRKSSINRLLDEGYEGVVSSLAKTVELGRTRLVLDDYGVGQALKQFLATLDTAGAELLCVNRADDRYLECRLAALVAKREQQLVLESLRRDKRYQLPGQDLGSGNPGDPRTLAWLQAWRKSGRAWPWFVKQSFRTVQEIERSGASLKGRSSE